MNMMDLNYIYCLFVFFFCSIFFYFVFCNQDGLVLWLGFYTLVFGVVEHKPPLEIFIQQILWHGPHHE